jgi:glycosyltransferase involved in cell wall biosynthesis
VKISCILTSYNRPTFVRDALKSVADQTHRDFELFVMDDSNLMEIGPIVREFDFPEVHVRHEDVSPEARASVNRLSVNINKALKEVRGDLVCFLADDDYYFPEWFEKANAHFEKHPDHYAGFGILKYSYDRKMDLRDSGEIRFWDQTIIAPFGQLDHNQVIHRRFDPPFKWNEGIGTAMNPDAWYWNEIVRIHPFQPIVAWAAVKRIHGKNLQNHISDLQGGKLNGLRE